MSDTDGVYCHTCAVELCLLKHARSSVLLQTEYRLESLLRDLAGPAIVASSEITSLLENATTSRYRDFVVSAAASGLVRIENNGRRRGLVIVAGRGAGYTWKGKEVIGPSDGMVLVLSSNPLTVDAYPMRLDAIRRADCEWCGEPLVDVPQRRAIATFSGRRPRWVDEDGQESHTMPCAECGRPVPLHRRKVSPYAVPLRVQSAVQWCGHPLEVVLVPERNGWLREVPVLGVARCAYAYA